MFAVEQNITSEIIKVTNEEVEDEDEEEQDQRMQRLRHE